MNTSTIPPDRTSILRALDKRDRLGYLGVFDLLTEGRTDASGHFTEGCGLSVGQATYLLAFLAATDDSPDAQRIKLLWNLTLSEGVLEYLSEATANDPVKLRAAVDQVLGLCCEVEAV